jgi:hypothetical protein
LWSLGADAGLPNDGAPSLDLALDEGTELCRRPGLARAPISASRRLTWGSASTFITSV